MREWCNVRVTRTVHVAGVIVIVAQDRGVKMIGVRITEVRVTKVRGGRIRGTGVLDAEFFKFQTFEK